MTKEELKKQALLLPLLPGVYFMKDALGNIIYVGKSKALKRRVSSYFSGSKKPAKVERMVRHIDHFEVHYTDTELDALILECRLIKQHRPIYNRLLKQDHKYRYLYVNPKEARPRVKLVREQTLEGSYFGPYEKGQSLYHAVEVMNTFYGLPDCKPQEIKVNCLTYKRGQCLGPCNKPYDESTFMRQLEAVCRFLEGEEEAIIKNYEMKMVAAAEALDFEQALAHKVTWEALKALHFKREAMQFAASYKVSVLKLSCPAGGDKIWIWLGTKGVWSKVLKKKAKGKSLEKMLREAKMAYEEIRKMPLSPLKKEEMDEAQIIYSMLKKEESSWHQSFIASGDLEKDGMLLEKILKEVINS